MEVKSLGQRVSRRIGKHRRAKDPGREQSQCQEDGQKRQSAEQALNDRGWRVLYLSHDSSGP